MTKSNKNNENNQTDSIIVHSLDIIFYYLYSLTLCKKDTPNVLLQTANTQIKWHRTQHFIRIYTFSCDYNLQGQKY